MLYSVLFSDEKEYIIKANNILDALVVAKKISKDVIAIALTNFTGFLEGSGND